MPSSPVVRGPRGPPRLPRPTERLRGMLPVGGHPAMFLSFFALAARSPARQATFRRAVVLHLMVAAGRLDLLDPLPLLVMPWTWGAVTGLGLAVWAYEPARVRRWGERVVMGMVLLYLLVGVVAGENLRRWVDVLPSDLAA